MRKILQLFLSLSLMLLLLPPAVQAQERTITGTILSEDNKTPLSGVTVRVKGTRRIVQTDAEGKFSIKVNPGETLQVSYVGYETSDVKVGDGNTLGISLKAADNMMREVQQGRRIRRALARQVDTNKGTNCLTVVNRVLYPFVRQPETLLGNVHPQHARQTCRRTSATARRRIERHEHAFRSHPRHNRLKLLKETALVQQNVIGRWVVDV